MILAVWACSPWGLACQSQTRALPGEGAARPRPDVAPSDAGATDAASLAMPGIPADAPDGGADAEATAGEGDGGRVLAPEDDPMFLHKTTRQELRELFSIKTLSEKETKTILPDPFFFQVLGTEDSRHMNQGNKALSMHTVSQRACEEGLRGVPLQTPEQKAACGAENMVPVNFAGKPAYYCIDQFEFPNKPCALPFVWAAPAFAKKMCELQGKRLCTQGEWSQACRGDPAGGKDTKYAYGDELDLQVCHTNRPHRQRCDVRSIKGAWETCTTDTEPAGAFPKCRSRFGVFDLHGNVAEIMTRRDYDEPEYAGRMVSQLKGSAWFYTEVAMEPGKPPKPKKPGEALQETYPDHCNFDPRWHVEPLDQAFHVNYHLGFRCCKTIP